MRVLIYSAIPLALALALAACHVRNLDLEFEEEVLLADDTVLVVSHRAKASPLGEIGGPGGWDPSYASLEITSPKSNNDPAKWESDLGVVPVLFDKDPVSQEWTVLATYITCEPWYRLGRPKLPYAEFRFRNDRWQLVDFSPQWIGRRTNVYPGIESTRGPGRLTLREKRVLNSDPAIGKEFVEIVGKWAAGC